MSIDPLTLAITIAINAAAYAMTASRTIEGPRVTDLEGTTADYGVPLNNALGTDRLECPCFFVEPIREVKKKRKTKGGKYNEYTYFGTFAVVVNDGQVNGFRKVWLDRHLVYNVNTGENLFELDDDYELEHYMRFYRGTSDQLPDPRMQAFIEAEDGPNTCPAFLDVAYLFFEDLPLERLGNRYPQVSVEIGYPDDIGEGDFVWYMDSDSTLIEGNSPAYKEGLSAVSPNGVYVAGGDPNDTHWVASLSAEGDPTLVLENHYYDRTYYDADLNPYDGLNVYAVDDQGTMWGDDGSGINGIITAVDLDDPNSPYVAFKWTNNGGSAFGLGVSAIFTFTMPDGSIKILMFPRGDTYNSNSLYFLGTKGSTTLTEYDSGGTWYPNYAFQDSNGDIWITGTEGLTATGTNKFHLERITNVTSISPYPASQWITGLPEIDTTGGGAYRNGSRAVGFFKSGYFICGWGATQANLYANAYLLRVALNGSGSFTSRDISAAPVYAPGPNPNFPYFQTDQRHFFVVPTSNDRAASEISTSDLSTITDYNLNMWDPPHDDDVNVVFYVDSVLGLIGNQNYPTEIGELYVYILPAGPLSLGDIIRHVCAKENMTDGEDFDADECNDIPVTGFHYTQASGQAIIGPLLDFYQIMPRQHNYMVEFIKRGRASVATITAEEMYRPRGGSLYEITTVADSDLPRRVFITFADQDGDELPNTAVAQRNLQAVGTVRELPLDMRNLVLAASEAKQRTDQFLRHIWFTALRAKFSTGFNHYALEAGDNVDVDFDGEGLVITIKRLRMTANEIIDIEGERYAAEVAAISETTVGAPATGNPPDEVFMPGDTEGFFLDIPQLSDAYEQSAPYLLLAAGPVAQDDFWPGADMQYNLTGATDQWSSGWDSIASSDAATWGTVAEALPDALTEVVDYGSELTVTIHEGELTSITIAQAYADQTLNMALIGDEIVQFLDADLIANTTTYRQYTVSGFLRGIRGTEWAVADHEAGERFLLLSPVRKHTVGASEIALTRWYRATTLGRGESSGDIQNFVFGAAAQKPRSPTHVIVTHNPANNSFLIEWTRRSRIGEASVDGGDVPLGETSEEYRVTISSGSGSERTATVTSPEFEYTEAMQIADFGSAQSFIAGSVLQRSPSLGLDGYETVFSGSA